MADRVAMSIQLPEATAEEFADLFPEARNEQEAIVICISNEMHRRRSAYGQSPDRAEFAER